MDRKFLTGLPYETDVNELKQELIAVAMLERENPRRLQALGFAAELCVAVSAAASPDDKNQEASQELLMLAAEGSNTVHFGVSRGDSQAPVRMAEILDEFCSSALKLVG